MATTIIRNNKESVAAWKMRGPVDIASIREYGLSVDNGGKITLDEPITFFRGEFGGALVVRPGENELPRENYSYHLKMNGVEEILNGTYEDGVVRFTTTDSWTRNVGSVKCLFIIKEVIDELGNYNQKEVFVSDEFTVEIAESLWADGESVLLASENEDLLKLHRDVIEINLSERNLTLSSTNFGNEGDRNVTLIRVDEKEADKYIIFSQDKQVVYKFKFEGDYCVIPEEVTTRSGSWYVNIIWEKTDERIISNILSGQVQENFLNQGIIDQEIFDNNGIAIASVDEQLLTAEGIGSYKLDFTGEEIDEKLEQVNSLQEEVNSLQEEVNSLQEEVNKLKENTDNLDSKNDKLQKQIANLKASAEGKTFNYEVDSSVAYEKAVPANASPYASLDKIGGMSYKSKNILDFSKLKVDSYNASIDYNNKTVTILNGKFYGNTSNTLKEICPLLNVGDTLYVNAVYSNSDAMKEITVNVDGLNPKSYRFNTAIKITEEMLNNKIRFYNNYGFNSDPNIISNIIFSKEPITEYEDYYEGIRNTSVTNVKVVGENILDTSETLDIRNHYGVTFTKLGDGGFKVFGTNNRKAYSILGLNTSDGSNQINMNLPAGTYTFGSFRTTKDVNIELKLYYKINNNSNGYIRDTITDAITTSTTFTIDKNAEFGVYFIIKDGAKVNDTIYPYLVRRETAPTEFKTYIEHNFAIPSTIQELDGYGLGIDETYYNYIDYDRKVFMRKVGKYVFTGDEVWKEHSNVTYPFIYVNLASLNAPIPSIDTVNYQLCNYFNNKGIGETTNNKGIHYFKSGTVRFRDDTYNTPELMKAYCKQKYDEGNPLVIMFTIEPIETDISEYLTSDNFIEVESNGTITFENEYNLACGSEVTYEVKL